MKHYLMENDYITKRVNGVWKSLTLYGVCTLLNKKDEELKLLREKLVNAQNAIDDYLSKNTS